MWNQSTHAFQILRMHEVSTKFKLKIILFIEGRDGGWRDQALLRTKKRSQESIRRWIVQTFLLDRKPFFSKRITNKQYIAIEVIKVLPNQTRRNIQKRIIMYVRLFCVVLLQLILVKDNFIANVASLDNYNEDIANIDTSNIDLTQVARQSVQLPKTVYCDVCTKSIRKSNWLRRVLSTKLKTK